MPQVSYASRGRLQLTVVSPVKASRLKTPSHKVGDSSLWKVNVSQLTTTMWMNPEDAQYLTTYYIPLSRDGALGVRVASRKMKSPRKSGRSRSRSNSGSSSRPSPAKKSSRRRKRSEITISEMQFHMNPNLRTLTGLGIGDAIKFINDEFIDSLDKFSEIMKTAQEDHKAKVEAAIARGVYDTSSIKSTLKVGVLPVAAISRRHSRLRSDSQSSADSVSCASSPASSSLEAELDLLDDVLSLGLPSDLDSLELQSNERATHMQSASTLKSTKSLRKSKKSFRLNHTTSRRSLFDALELERQASGPETQDDDVVDSDVKSSSVAENGPPPTLNTCGSVTDKRCSPSLCNAAGNILDSDMTNTTTTVRDSISLSAAGVHRRSRSELCSPHGQHHRRVLSDGISLLRTTRFQFNLSLGRERQCRSNSPLQSTSCDQPTLLYSRD